MRISDWSSDVCSSDLAPEASASTNSATRAGAGRVCCGARQGLSTPWTPGREERPCNIRAMAKTPRKRGSGRGKTGAGNGQPATKRDGPKKSTGKKANGKKLQGWMTDAAAGGKTERKDGVRGKRGEEREDPGG